MSVTPDHFRFIPDRAQAASLFKQTVETVEVEIHSYCNRTCSFCANSFIDRRSHKTVMDPALYSKIMDDLASIDYRGIVWYSRYNEPTADRPLFIERLREARRKLPHARLQTYSNGDYLTAEYIDALREAGLNELRIQTYLAPGQEGTNENYVKTTNDRLKRLGIPHKHVHDGYVELSVPGIAVSYNYADLEKCGTNRAGSVKTGVHLKGRVSPCSMPLVAVYVDYNGAMVPCCNIRSDYEQHKNCVVYTLTPENSIFEGYANSKLVSWRRSMLRFGEKKSPCDTCSSWLVPQTPETEASYVYNTQVIESVSKEHRAPAQDPLRAVYRDLAERFKAADSWFLAHRASDDYETLLAERDKKMAPLLEECAEALAGKGLYGEKLFDSKVTEYNYVSRIESLMLSERHIALALQYPREYYSELDLMQRDAALASLYCAHQRICQYLVWRRINFTMTATPERNGVSAVLRIKNELQNLRVILPALLSYFDEIVVVDHNSDDGTYAYVESLAHPKIRLFSYLTPTAIASEFYGEDLAAGKGGSRADYYNFAFAQASMPYVCKWDAAMYPLPALSQLLSKVRVGVFSVIFNRGLNCYGLDLSSEEPRIFRRELAKYYDGAHYERFDVPEDKSKQAKFEAPVYLHMKHPDIVKI